MDFQQDRSLYVSYSIGRAKEWEGVHIAHPPSIGLKQEEGIINFEGHKSQETAGSDREPAPRCSRHIIAIQPTQEAIEEIPVILRHQQPFATHQISHTLPQAATRQVQVRYHPINEDGSHQANRNDQHEFNPIH